MENQNGFTIDTEMSYTPEKKLSKSAKKKKLYKKLCICAAAALVVLIIFCATVPCIGYKTLASETVVENDSLEKRIDYYKNGKISTSQFWSGDEMYGEIKYYHKDGKLSKSESYTFGRLMEYTTYEYKGNYVTTATTYNNIDNTVTSITEELYENGLLTDKNILGGDKSIMIQHHYSYDEAGNCISAEIYDVDLDYTRYIEHTYENGQLTATTTRAGSYHNRTTTFTYDQNGKLIKEEADGSVILHSYTYKTVKQTVFGKLF